MLASSPVVRPLVPRYDHHREYRHTYETCLTCRHTYDPACPDCHGAGEILSRNQFIHHYLSAPCGSGENGRGVGYVLPLVHLSATNDPAWLATIIHNAVDLTGQALCIEQLLEVFDNISIWSQEVEPGARYWREAALAIVGIINVQLMENLPTEGGQH